MYPPGVVIDVTFDELLVLIVREAALRGLLIGQLSLAGEVLVTYDGPLDDTAFDRTARPPAILITDDETVAALFGILARGDRWRGFIHVADCGPTRTDKVATVDRAQATAQIRETLTMWRTARFH
ncbi:MAG: hypothetical protein V4475_07670 [Pseudomonadota bacterium]